MQNFSLLKILLKITSYSGKHAFNKLQWISDGGYEFKHLRYPLSESFSLSLSIYLSLSLSLSLFLSFSLSLSLPHGVLA